LAAESFYPTTIGKLSAQVKLYGNGSISELQAGEEVKFQTLTFQESQFQKVNVINEALYINGKTIYPKYVLDEFNNKYVSFIITENGDFNYELIADIEISSLIYEMSDYNVSKPIESVEIYTQPSEKVESGSTEIITLSKNKLLTNSFLDSVNKTVLWVNDYVEYASGDDFQKYYLLQRSAVETLISKKGVCDEFANLGAGMLRAKGIPTRLAIGITFDGKEWGNHAWIGVYHEKFGWIPSDPTFRESGFVDATHIKLGSFTDVTLSLAKAFFPSTANVSFYTQTIPEVNITSKEYFDAVELDSNTSQLKAQNWNNIYLTIKNKTNSTITAPVNIKESYSELIIQDKKKSVMLAPGETKTLQFKIYPNIELSKNQIAKGTITFNSLSAPYEKEFTINPGQKTNVGEVIIKDITPIAHEGKLQIQIITNNFYADEKTIDVNIRNNGTQLNSTEVLPGFSSKTTTKDFDLHADNAYYVSITTPTTVFTQTIVPEKQKIVIATDPKIEQTAVEQKIEDTTEVTLTDTITQNPILFVGGLLMIFSIILLGLFLVNKRYV
jgi:hypothetical protein